MNLTLVCWSCGDKLEIEVNRAPAFAFELSSLASQAGWIGAIDLEHHRSLVFCCKDHENMERKKNGSFRLLPKKTHNNRFHSDAKAAEGSNVKNIQKQEKAQNR